MSWRVIQADVLDGLAQLEDRSVQTCVTSPPYYGLRDYGDPGQIGLEASPDEYVARLVGVFREVRRTLRGDGTLWLNLGDSYAGSTVGGGGPGSSTLNGAHNRVATPRSVSTRSTPGCKPKDLLGIPWMVAFALRADGWYLRSDIIWAKPNPMPESVTDRPTKAHEYLFLLSKSRSYFYDADAIREEHLTGDRPGERVSYAAGSASNYHLGDGHRVGRHGPGLPINEAGRNKRSVWSVPTQPYPGTHFAVFPPKLIEPCVLAGSSAARSGDGYAVSGCAEHENKLAAEIRARAEGKVARPHPTKLAAWEVVPDPSRSMVLDPFSGAGTTGVVACRHDRDYVGIELNPEYAEMSRQRIKDDGPLLNVPSELAA